MPSRKNEEKKKKEQRKLCSEKERGEKSWASGVGRERRASWAFVDDADGSVCSCIARRAARERGVSGKGPCGREVLAGAQGQAAVCHSLSFRSAATRRI